jgi:hypothetical protein
VLNSKPPLPPQKTRAPALARTLMAKTTRAAQPTASLLRKVPAVLPSRCEPAGAGETGRVARPGVPAVGEVVTRRPVVKRPAVTGRAALAGQARLTWRRVAGGLGSAGGPGSARGPRFQSGQASNAPGAGESGRHCQVAPGGPETGGLETGGLEPGGREPGGRERQRPPPELVPPELVRPALTRLVLLVRTRPVLPLTGPGRDGRQRRGPLASR